MEIIDTLNGFYRERLAGDRFKLFNIDSINFNPNLILKPSVNIDGSYSIISPSDIKIGGITKFKSVNGAMHLKDTQMNGTILTGTPTGLVYRINLPYSLCDELIGNKSQFMYFFKTLNNKVYNMFMDEHGFDKTSIIVSDNLFTTTRSGPKFSVFTENDNGTGVELRFFSQAIALCDMK